MTGTRMIRVSRKKKLKPGVNWMVLFEKGLSWCFVYGIQDGSFVSKLDAELMARQLWNLHHLEILEIRKTTAKIDREALKQCRAKGIDGHGCRLWLDDIGSVLMVREKKDMVIKGPIPVRSPV